MRHTHAVRYRAFLKRLILAREDAGLTQRDVAQQLGIPQSRVSRIETGERRLDIIEALSFATLYRKPLAWFVP